MTYYIAFVIELQSRRVQIIGATLNPNEAFVLQALRHVTAAESVMCHGRVLICDRDPKWSGAVVAFVEDEVVRIIRTPARAPNCNAHAERFIRSIKDQCRDRMIMIGERHLGRAMAEFVLHCHAERNHQGLGND